MVPAGNRSQPAVSDLAASSREYGTPMCEALKYASDALSSWVTQYPDSFPPIVINVSDGNATDGDPVPLAHQIMNLNTSDGNALVFNIHLSEAATCRYSSQIRRRDCPTSWRYGLTNVIGSS